MIRAFILGALLAGCLEVALDWADPLPSLGANAAYGVTALVVLRTEPVPVSAIRRPSTFANSTQGTERAQQAARPLQ